MIRNHFQRLSNREKTLLVAVAWVALAFWGSLALGQTRQQLEQWRTTGATIGRQEQTLALSETIEAQLNRLHRELDPEKTFSAQELAAKVDTFAREHGLDYTIRTPRTEADGPITLHEISVSVRRANLLDTLLPFYQAIQNEAPYIALSKLSLNATSDPIELNAVFVINAFELSEKTTP